MKKTPKTKQNQTIVSLNTYQRKIIIIKQIKYEYSD